MFRFLIVQSVEQCAVVERHEICLRDQYWMEPTRCWQLSSVALIWTEIGLIAASIAAFLIYHQWTRYYRKWENSGVATVKPTFPFGNMLGLWKGTRAHFDLHKKRYNRLKGERYVQ
jgi:hypothetical protein